MVNTRARLLEDWQDDCGHKWTAGQIGEYAGVRNGLVLFHFDGYEDLKAEDAKMRSETGEGWNMVPWLAELPLSILETIK